MKLLFSTLLWFGFFISSYAQTLTNYVTLAQKKHHAAKHTNTTDPYTYSTSLQFGYFINPQYTISGAQRAYVELQQELPWLGKGNAVRKAQKNRAKTTQLQKQYELETLAYDVKACYYKMYQYLKHKNIYVAWAEEVRLHLAKNKALDSTSIELSLQRFENEALLLDLTKKLQLVDGDYQNQVIIFNELLKNETLDEPNVPDFLAMPEEESEFQFPDPFESASYQSFENEVLQQQNKQSIENPWSPAVSLGLKYISVSATDAIDFGLPNQDIIAPQLKLQWNLFSKKTPRYSEDQTNRLLDHKLSVLGHQLQTAINNQVSARIEYDTATQKLEKLRLISDQLNSKKTIEAEKILEIKGLKYTFELEQIKAVAEYYISTSKMLLYF